VARPALLAAVPVALVALVAGIVSFSHIVALAVRAGQSPVDAHLLPLAVDGLIVAGSVILAAGSALGWLGVVPGVGATLFANLESGLPHGQLAAVVATWPAVAFTVASFMLERWLKSQAVVSRSQLSDPPGPADLVHTHAPTASNGHAPVTAWAQPARSGWS
jgi:hypothetical protein